MLRNFSQTRRRNLPEEQRREMILDAALKAFAASGYDSCNVDAIAETAGIGKGTIYRHFPSKLELFAAVVDRGHNALLAQFVKVIELPVNVAEHMSLGLGQFVDFFVEHPDYYRVMMIEQPEVRLSVNLDMDAGYQHFLKEIVKTIRDDIKAGRIKKVEPEFTAQFFFSLMKLIVERQLYGKGHSQTRDIREAVEITLKGLLI